MGYSSFKVQNSSIFKVLILKKEASVQQSHMKLYLYKSVQYSRIYDNSVEKRQWKRFIDFHSNTVGNYQLKTISNNSLYIFTKSLTVP